MKEQPTNFKTRKGQSVYRRRTYKKNSTQPSYASHYTFRVQRDHGDAYFNLGTDKRKAGATADKVMAFLSIEGNTVEEALVSYSKTHRSKQLKEVKKAADNFPKLRKKKITVGMICERYQQVTNHLSATTVTINLSSLRRIAAGVLELPKMGKGKTKIELEAWHKNIDNLALSELTPERIEAFRQRELNAVKDDHAQQGSTTTSLNCYLRSARSVFAEKMLIHYHDLELPNPLPLYGIKKLTEPSHRYHSQINEADFMQAAMNELRGKEPESWIIILLSFGVGLRRKEIDKLLWEQVDFENRRIWIKTTKYFRPKAINSEYFVDVSTAVMNEITEYRATRQTGLEDNIFVLPGRITSGSKLRAQELFRKTYRWLRKQGINTQKPLHTLRKEAGSILLEKSGNLQKVADFLRNDMAVTSAHYVGRKERIEMELPGLG